MFGVLAFGLNVVFLLFRFLDVGQFIVGELMDPFVLLRLCILINFVVFFVWIADNLVMTVNS